MFTKIKNEKGLVTLEITNEVELYMVIVGFGLSSKSSALSRFNYSSHLKSLYYSTVSFVLDVIKENPEWGYKYFPLSDKVHAFTAPVEIALGMFLSGTLDDFTFVVTFTEEQYIKFCYRLQGGMY